MSNFKKEIKSYVIRTRMSPLQKKSYENFYARYCIPYSENFLNYADLFPGHIKKTVVEIGFGMGDATLNIAVNNPETGYIAIEVHKPGIGKLLAEIEKRNLDNVRIIEYDAVKTIRCMISDSSLAGIHVFFPDPWPKKKHHKRRLINEEFVKVLAGKLSDGGYIYIATDWQDYAEKILNILNNSVSLVNKFKDYAVDIPWRPKTRFENKGLLKAHKIYELYFIKKIK